MIKVMHNDDKVICELSHQEFDALSQTTAAEVPDETNVNINWLAQFLGLYENQKTGIQNMKGKIDNISNILGNILNA